MTLADWNAGNYGAIILLDLTAEEHRGLYRPAVEVVGPLNVSGSTCRVLAKRSSAARVERGGMFVVWTVIASDGGPAGEVRRHYPRRCEGWGEGWGHNGFHRDARGEAG